MNKYIRSTGTVCVFISSQFKGLRADSSRKIEQLKPEFIHRKGVWKSIWNYSLCFTAGALLLWIMRFYLISAWMTG